MFFADDTDLLRIRRLFERRAAHMVTEAYAEGTRRAQAYARAGGRARKGAHTQFRIGSKAGVRGRIRRATGNQIARMTEKVLYHRFTNFWNLGW